MVSKIIDTTICILQLVVLSIRINFQLCYFCKALLSPIIKLETYYCNNDTVLFIVGFYLDQNVTMDYDIYGLTEIGNYSMVFWRWVSNLINSLAYLL